MTRLNYLNSLEEIEFSIVFNLKISVKFGFHCLDFIKVILKYDQIINIDDENGDPLIIYLCELRGSEEDFL